MELFKCGRKRVLFQGRQYVDAIDHGAVCYECKLAVVSVRAVAMNTVSSPKRIHVIAAGMRHLPSPAALQTWLDTLRELGVVARVSSSVIGASQGGDISVAVIKQLINDIVAHYASADGIVILHGLDDVLMTSTVTSYCLNNLAKPIVFTIAGPPSAAVTELSPMAQQANLINAVHVATLPVPEVCLVFGNRLLRASDAVRSQTTTGAVSFDSPQSGILGRIDFSIRLNNRQIRPLGRGKLQALPLAQKIVSIQLTPWLTADWLTQQLASAEGLMLDARPANSLPNWLTAYLQQQLLPCAVVVLLNPPAVLIDRREIVTLTHAKPQAALAKLAWAAAVAKTSREAAALVSRPLAGEPEL